MRIDLVSLDFADVHTDYTIDTLVLNKHFRKYANTKIPVKIVFHSFKASIQYSIPFHGTFN